MVGASAAPFLHVAIYHKLSSHPPKSKHEMAAKYLEGFIITYLLISYPLQDTHVLGDILQDGPAMIPAGFDLDFLARAF